MWTGLPNLSLTDKSGNALRRQPAPPAEERYIIERYDFDLSREAVGSLPVALSTEGVLVIAPQPFASLAIMESALRAPESGAPATGAQVGALDNADLVFWGQDGWDAAGVVVGQFFPWSVEQFAGAVGQSVPDAIDTATGLILGLLPGIDMMGKDSVYSPAPGVGPVLVYWNLRASAAGADEPLLSEAVTPSVAYVEAPVIVFDKAALLADMGL